MNTFRKHLLFLGFLLLAASSLSAQVDFLRGAEIQEENTITITNDLYAAVNAPMSNYNSSTQVRLRYDDLKVLETAPAF
ncbi:MAG: hypothetical protein ACKOXB_10680, partial [Flavobacteriales bacterium]